MNLIRVIVLCGFVAGMSVSALAVTDEDFRALKRLVEEQAKKIQALERQLAGTPEAPPAVEEAGASRAAAGPKGRKLEGSSYAPASGNLPNIGVVFDAVYQAGDNSRDRAQFRGAELNIGAPVDPLFDAHAVVAFTTNEVALEEGYVTSHLPWNLKARYGLELMPFGDMNTWHLHDQPQVDNPQVLTQFFGAEGLRGIGGHVEWLAPISKPAITAIIGAYNNAYSERGEIADGDNDGVSHNNDGVFNLASHNRGPLMLGRISAFTDWSGGRHALRIGGSYAEDDNDPRGRARTRVWGIDGKYRWAPDASGRQLVIAGEYLSHDREERAFTVNNRAGGADLDNRGWFAYGQYDFNPRWGLGYRYDAANTTFSGTNEIKSNSVYAEFRPSEFSRLRVQYRNDDRNFDVGVPGIQDDDDNVIMIQATHAIGWHPAHKF